MIRKVNNNDASAIADIYNYYIEHTIVTFEEVLINSKEMERRIKEFDSKYPWLVYEQSGEIVAYAYASKWKERIAYRYAVETTIYLKNGVEGQGIGSKLYHNLITRIKALDIHSIIGGISLPNPGSVALHEKFGYKKVAHFKEVGYKFGKWIDVEYWEIIV